LPVGAAPTRQGIKTSPKCQRESTAETKANGRVARHVEGADIDDPAIVANVLGRPLQREERALGVDAEQTIEIGLGNRRSISATFETSAWIATAEPPPLPIAATVSAAPFRPLRS
jgi:hypothetical protein